MFLRDYPFVSAKLDFNIMHQMNTEPPWTYINSLHRFLGVNKDSDSQLTTKFCVQKSHSCKHENETSILKHQSNSSYWGQGAGFFTIAALPAHKKPHLHGTFLLGSVSHHSYWIKTNKAEPTDHKDNYRILSRLSRRKRSWAVINIWSPHCPKSITNEVFITHIVTGV